MDAGTEGRTVEVIDRNQEEGTKEALRTLVCERPFFKEGVGRPMAFLGGGLQ